MTPWLDDGDVRLYHGDALETLRGLPDGSVDCVVTSPPYWGLRDYGTGEWDGGDPDHKHETKPHRDGRGGSGAPGKQTVGAFPSEVAVDECSCGARRVDQQMGLEPTPDLFVAGMVELFREVRRVLADHGTCWVNLGDSYATGTSTASKPSGNVDVGYWENADKIGRSRIDGREAGLKPKDLVGIPWRVAFALQADGWYLRSDIIWWKPNPMPESVTDRPTKAHEYVFLLTKRPRYWFDAEAVREPQTEATLARYEYGFNRVGKGVGPGLASHTKGNGADGGEITPNPAGRNVRSVWQIATQPYPEAHFATFPEELARRCILAGCPVRVCRVCGKPSERIVERVETKQGEAYEARMERAGNDFTPLNQPNRSAEQVPIRYNLSQSAAHTVGWSDCGHNNWRPGQVLDPFIGSGTTAKVARDHQRHAIGIDLNQTYLELAARRLRQLSLLTGGTA